MIGEGVGLKSVTSYPWILVMTQIVKPTSQSILDVTAPTFKVI